ncbi:TonB-dependent siderophore receptor [Novosphingobium sp.]|uniref:TonB-dependent receptor n=1 Tax=Novosphingobium sp. TaxID=1874826 RepID=UPI00333F75CD
MPKNQFACLFASSLLGMIGASPPACADDDAERSGAIVVTGKVAAAQVSLAKLPPDLHDSPQSITVLDKALLQSQGATSLADALRNVPGITLGAAEGGQIGNNINLNGFTARTDIYLDGMRDRGQYYRDTFALDNVEVLMGPSSMLFGRGSTGGVINQVSNRPRLSPRAEASASVNSNGMTRATAGVNQPIAATVALRIDAMAQAGAPGTRRATAVHDYGVAPALAIGLGTPTVITLNGLVQHNNDRPDYGVSPLNGAPVAVGRNTVFGYADDRTIQNVRAASVALRHNLSDAVTLRDKVQYNAVDTDAVETAANTIGSVDATGFHALAASAMVTPTSAAPLNTLWVRLQSHDRVIHDTSLFNQAELAAKFATGALRHDLIAGVEIGRDTYRNQNFYRNGTCNGVALNPANGLAGYTGCTRLVNPDYTASPANAVSRIGNLATGRADTLAVYASDTMAIGAHVKLVGGLRYDRFAATVANSINATNTAGNTTLASASQTVHFLSVRTGAIWQPATNQSYYASYSTSFNPSLEQLTSTTGITQPLPPERNRAYEAGGKWDIAQGRLALNAALFQITKTNARSQNADSTYSADGTVRVRGVRLGASGRINTRWQVYAGYAHLDARIVQGIAVNTEGKVPVNTPRDAATLWTTHSLGRDWELGGGATYQSRRFANNTNLVSVGSTLRSDATLAWHQSRFDVRLNIFNAFNVHYADALIQSDGGRSVPGTGRTALVSFNGRF